MDVRTGPSPMRWANAVRAEGGGGWRDAQTDGEKWEGRRGSSVDGRDFRRESLGGKFEFLR